LFEPFRWGIIVEVKSDGMAERPEGIRTFGQWVKHQRKALGLTQAELAQRVACSKSMINKIEGDLRSRCCENLLAWRKEQPCLTDPV
jgi:DNA-binding XRE family transcriptional regulator